MYVVIRVSIRIMRKINGERQAENVRIVDGIQTTQYIIVPVFSIGLPVILFIVRIVYYYYN